jgi:excisionase family DNA binding protein
MQLTLQQAAVSLGKTRRQVQYLIQQGRLPAKKIGGRWYVESSALQQDPAASQRANRRDAQLQSAIEEALRPPNTRRSYSLRDLKAFQVLLPLYRRLLDTQGSEHPASRHLKTALEHLAQGCHRFGNSEKTSAYRACRDATSLAVLELMLEGDAHVDFVNALEGDFMAALAGLLRRAERKRDSLS